MNISKNLK